MSRRGLIRNTFTVGAFTALSRVLGLVREMMQSRLVGAGVQQSAFALAFAIPNMARKMFGEGALTAAFVPVFKGELENGTNESAARLARSVMTMVLLMLSAIALLAMGGLGLFAWVHESSGAASGRFVLTASLVMTLLPYMVFICAAAFGMGVLNAMGRFKASSFMPCLLNICWICALAWLWFSGDRSADVRVKKISVAILGAGVLQAAFMFWMMARRGVVPYPSFSGWRSEKVKTVWRNVAIGALGAGAIQINYMLDQLLAQLAAPWAAGVVGYAERLMDLPLGVIGVAFGTVLLPAFAGYFARDDVPGAKAAFSSSLSSMLYVMIPAGFGLAVLAPEAVSAIYQGGEFDATATLRVSRAVAVYAAGMGFFGVQKVLVPWFHAQKDMKTPLKISVQMVIVNAALNIAAVAFLPVEFRHVGLAASTVVCAAAGSAILYCAAKKKNGDMGILAALRPIARYAAASAAMAALIFWLRPHVMHAVSGGKGAVFAFAALGLLSAAGACFYVLATKPREAIAFLCKRKRRQQ